MTDGANPPSVFFNRVRPVGRELEYLQQVVASCRLAGDGEFSRRCEALLARELGASRVLLTTSCTHALELAALVLDVRPGDEVLMPSFTFVSTANAFVLRGARPVFVDVHPDSFNIDERLLESAITRRSRAVVPVHYAGVGCEMDEIVALAEARGLSLIEDNAHGLFGRYRGRYLGTFGAMSTLSFHETKNFTCGEGGALVLNDPALHQRAEILREKGTDRSRFFRGEVDKYTWLAAGSSYVPSELLAAFLLGQLEQRQLVQSSRRRLWERYAGELADWAARNGVTLPAVPADRESAYHLFAVLFPSRESRDGMIEHLRGAGVRAVFHYVPLHLSDMGRALGYQAGDYPVTEAVSERLLRLPFYTTLEDREQQQVISTILSFAV